jgi:hypothetical protein
MEKTDKIAHVPKIVYHWRTVEGSTSNRITAKPYVLKGQLRAIEKHLQHVGWKAKPYHDWTGQLYIDWLASAKHPVFLIHAVYKGLGDAHIRELRKLLNEVQKQLNGSPRVMIFALEKEASKKTLRKLRSLSGVSVHEYEAGGFVGEAVKALADEPSTNVIYVSDSVKKIRKDSGETNWVNQFSGWLSTDEIGMIGGLNHAPDGRVVDCGSFFDKDNKRFCKFYFGTGHRSGYIGHLQWTRNFILPSERLFAFRNSILQSAAKRLGKGIEDFRDDELPKLIAAENYALGLRAVYDASVAAIDRAPFHIMIPLSEALESYYTQRSDSLLEKGDPYHNPNLVYASGDPKPMIGGLVTPPPKYELVAADFVLIN